ncbi:MAG: hypothetical protein WBR33_14030 [Pseudonocardiaceae bacterium]
MADAVGKPHPEVVGFQEPRLPCLLRREVNQAQMMQHRLGDRGVKPREVGEIEVGQ